MYTSPKILRYEQYSPKIKPHKIPRKNPIRMYSDKPGRYFFLICSDKVAPVVKIFNELLKNYPQERRETLTLIAYKFIKIENADFS